MNESRDPQPYLEWFAVSESTIREVMGELSRHGVDQADVYFQHSRSNSIVFQDGIVSRASTSVDQGVGVRAVVGDQVGYAYTEELTPESMKGAARSAAAIARGAQGGRIEVPGAFRTTRCPSYYELSVPWADVGVQRKLPLIRRVAELAKGSDPAIEKVQIYWADSEERVLLADLAGRIVTDYRPMTRLHVSLTATRNGVTQSHGSNIAAREGIEWYSEQRLAAVVKEAAERTMILFEARRPPAGEFPVVLAAGASGILLHEAIGHGMEADFNRKNTSIYADMLGKKIAPDFVNIVDDGTVAHHRGALNVDDEGEPCGKTVLVENGVLASYLHDSISARHYGVKSTGSGRRESFRHAPLPRMRCTYMMDGPHTPGEIIASVKKGIIAETFTNGQVQIGAGDFTFYIKNGWLIENGKVTAPIKDCNIIGNGPEALKAVTMAANDFKLDTGGWTCGKDGQSVPVSQGLPTVLVSELTVGGTNA
ncbi:MAG: metallopeptidase TldD-related protein [Nannocystaceae bacterium]